MRKMFLLIGAVCAAVAIQAQNADEWLDKARISLQQWQPDDALQALEQCEQAAANDTSMLMTVYDYRAAAWLEKGDVYFFNEHGRTARDLWDEWQPDSDALIPWISLSVDGCLDRILAWGSEQDAAEQARVREQARQMMARTFGEQSEHYRNWVAGQNE